MKDILTLQGRGTTQVLIDTLGEEKEVTLFLPTVYAKVVAEKEYNPYGLDAPYSSYWEWDYDITPEDITDVELTDKDNEKYSNPTVIKVLNPEKLDFEIEHSEPNESYSENILENLKNIIKKAES